MHDSGIWSVQLLLVTISITPVLRLINWVGYGADLGRWLLKRRKHFGLGSFLFAVVHLIHYVLYTGALYDIIYDALSWRFATGWIAFFIFAALAITSNNRSVKVLGRRWKKLHLWIYPALALTYLHWYLFDQFVERVLFWLSIAIGIKVGHIAVINFRNWSVSLLKSSKI